MKVAIFLLLATAAIETSHALVTLNRGVSPWTKEWVKSLLNAGNISANMLPDLRAIASTDLHIEIAWGWEMVWFFNGIAKVGANNLQVRMGDIVTNLDDTQIKYFKSLGLDHASVRLASQELLDINKTTTVIIPDAMLSIYHASHSHLHIADIAEFGIEQFDDSTNSWNVITGRDVVKQTLELRDLSGK